MRLSQCQEMRPDSPALGAEQSMVTIKHERSLDFLDGTPESPQEICHCVEGPWGHRSNTKEFCLPQINLRSRRIPLHWLQSHRAFTIKHDKWFDIR